MRKEKRKKREAGENTNTRWGDDVLQISAQPDLFAADLVVQITSASSSVHIGQQRNAAVAAFQFRFFHRPIRAFVQPFQLLAFHHVILLLSFPSSGSSRNRDVISSSLFLSTSDPEESVSAPKKL
jgi:hypothetical protein